MSPPLISTWTIVSGPQHHLNKNCLTNLSIVPHPITRIWEFSIPIPNQILAFLHIEEGLIINFEVTISAHQTEDYYNTFCIEISFRQYQNIVYPHIVEIPRIVLGYLWPNPYYQVNEEEITQNGCLVFRTSKFHCYQEWSLLVTPSIPEIMHLQ